MKPSVVHDWRDRAVLEALDRLDPGIVTTELLFELYQTETDIQRNEVRRRRVKNLTTRDEFVHVGFGEWRWEGKVTK